ncbi:hypothetical protein DIPPA_12223 [Diplonema papillatum]|nr:hypothetical protein DIPPA_12223 [Diplonema papillatum]
MWLVILVVISCGLLILLLSGVGVMCKLNKRMVELSVPVRTDPYEQLDGVTQSEKTARYKPGQLVKRNLQDTMVTFRFGGEIGTLVGPDSIGRAIVIDSIFADEKGDLKYRVEKARTPCKVSVLEKHFDSPPKTSEFHIGDTVVRNNIDRKLEFNMKGSLGVVRPGTAATVASVFADNDGNVKYTLLGAVNWLPEEKFVKYFAKAEHENTPRETDTVVTIVDEHPPLSPHSDSEPEKLAVDERLPADPVAAADEPIPVAE